MSETYPEFLQLLRKPSNPNIPIASYDMLRWRAADEIVRLRNELGAKQARVDELRLVQKIMARLADLLDSDQFNNIEAMVLDAGIPYPPLLDAETPKTDAACFVDPMGGEVVNADVARELERELRALRARDGYVLVEPPGTQIRRFTAYRRNISQRETHNELQKNPDDQPQYEGVIFTDGSVSLRWRTAIHCTSVWSSLQDALSIHGHPEYGSEIVWHDGETPIEWSAMLAAAEKGQCDECEGTGWHWPASETDPVPCPRGCPAAEKGKVP